MVDHDRHMPKVELYLEHELFEQFRDISYTLSQNEHFKDFYDLTKQKIVEALFKPGPNHPLAHAPHWLELTGESLNTGAGRVVITHIKVDYSEWINFLKSFNRAIKKKNNVLRGIPSEKKDYSSTTTWEYEFDRNTGFIKSISKYRGDPRDKAFSWKNNQQQRVEKELLNYAGEEIHAGYQAAIKLDGLIQQIIRNPNTKIAEKLRYQPYYNALEKIVDPETEDNFADLIVKA